MRQQIMSIVSSLSAATQTHPFSPSIPSLHPYHTNHAAYFLKIVVKMATQNVCRNHRSVQSAAPALGCFVRHPQWRWALGPAFAALGCASFPRRSPMVTTVFLVNWPQCPSILLVYVFPSRSSLLLFHGSAPHLPLTHLCYSRQRDIGSEIVGGGREGEDFHYPALVAISLSRTDQPTVGTTAPPTQSHSGTSPPCPVSHKNIGRDSFLLRI